MDSLTAIIRLISAYPAKIGKLVLRIVDPMAANSFEKSNINWQLRMLQQQVAQWWELQTDQFKNNLSHTPLPFGLDNLDIETLWWITKILGGLGLAVLLFKIVQVVWQRLSPYLYTFQLRHQTRKLISKNTQSELSVVTWLKRSQKFQQIGNYRDACLCLYKAMLQQLNDQGLIPDEPSRTDGEYLHLTQALPDSQAYRTLLLMHQELCFNQADISQGDFEQCQNAYQHLFNQS